MKMTIHIDTEKKACSFIRTEHIETNYTAWGDDPGFMAELAEAFNVARLAMGTDPVPTESELPSMEKDYPPIIVWESEPFIYSDLVAGGYSEG